MKQYKTLDMNDGRGGEHIQTRARPLWIISTFLISYLLNLASSAADSTDSITRRPAISEISSPIRVCLRSDFQPAL